MKDGLRGGYEHLLAEEFLDGEHAVRSGHDVYGCIKVSIPARGKQRMGRTEAKGDNRGPKADHCRGLAHRGEHPVHRVQQAQEERVIALKLVLRTALGALERVLLPRGVLL